MPTKLPFMQFFPRDWTADPALRVVSLAARGLWVELLCLMWQAPDRGYLIGGLGAALTPEQIARAVGATPDEVRAMLAELEAAGVFTRDGRGVIYSRRMVRDEQFRAKCSDAGKKGGNPAFNGPENPGAKRRGKGWAKGADKGRGKGADKASEGQKVRGSEGENPPTPRSADAGEGKTTGPKVKREREPNPLFDAVAEVTGLDPATAGGRIGQTAATLAAADPPYSPDDVRAFGRRFWQLCPWAAKDARPRPTPAELANHVGLLRAPDVLPDVPDRPPRPGGLIPFDRGTAADLRMLDHYHEARRAAGG